MHCHPQVTCVRYRHGRLSCSCKDIGVHAHGKHVRCMVSDCCLEPARKLLFLTNTLLWTSAIGRWPARLLINPYQQMNIYTHVIMLVAEVAPWMEAKCGASVQASRLRSKLAEQKIPEEALWVTSPLTRAIDTLILACPQPQRLGPPIPPLAEAEAGPSAASQRLHPYKVVVRRSLSGCT